MRLILYVLILAATHPFLRQTTMQTPCTFAATGQYHCSSRDSFTNGPILTTQNSNTDNDKAVSIVASFSKNGKPTIPNNKTFLNNTSMSRSTWNKIGGNSWATVKLSANCPSCPICPTLYTTKIEPIDARYDVPASAYIFVRSLFQGFDFWNRELLCIAADVFENRSGMIVFGEGGTSLNFGAFGRVCITKDTLSSIPFVELQDLEFDSSRGRQKYNLRLHKIPKTA